MTEQNTSEYICRGFLLLTILVGLDQIQTLSFKEKGLDQSKINKIILLNLIKTTLCFCEQNFCVFSYHIFVIICMSNKKVCNVVEIHHYHTEAPHKLKN